MGRYRVNCNNKTISSGEYNNRIKGLNLIKHARSKDHDKKDENFTVNYNTWNIQYFKSYNDYLLAAKAFFIINPDCNLCPDVPLDIKQGLNSEICYDELLEHVNNCHSHPCKKCDLVLKLDICKNLNHILYPYGHFNNNCLGRNFKFPVKINVQCCKSELVCPDYNFCKCPAFWDEKCCKYQVMFPSECKFIYYEKQGKPFIEPLAKERGCCLPVAKKHRCVNCYLCFAPPCPADYHCPNCNYHYETEGHYLDERNNFNCKDCNNVIKLDPYFETSCNKCDKKYIPHGKHCPHIKNYCEEIKEKHIYAFSVFPKMKESNDVRINKIMNKKKETPRDKYFRMRETAFKKK
jgi:hypothetical protein